MSPSVVSKSLIKSHLYNKLLYCPLTDGVRAKIYLRASKQNINGVDFLQLEDLKMDFSVKELKMGIENVHNGNAVIGDHTHGS